MRNSVMFIQIKNTRELLEILEACTLAILKTMSFLSINV